MPISASGNLSLYLRSPEFHTGSISLYILHYDIIESSGNIIILGNDGVDDELNLFLNGEINIYDNIDLFVYGLDINESSGNLFVYGSDVDLTIDNLYIQGHDIFSQSENLYTYGDIEVNSSGTLFINGTYDTPSIDRTILSFVRQADFYPQFIGKFDSTVIDVSIKVWDIVDGSNIELDLVSDQCYQIDSTGRWTWSTINLPPTTRDKEHYYYRMFGYPSGAFDGEIIFKGKYRYPRGTDYILRR
jgi:hypothetical protein